MNQFRVIVNFDPKQILEFSLDEHPMQRLRENARSAFGANAAAQSETLCGCIWTVRTALSEEEVARRLLVGISPSVAVCQIDKLTDLPEKEGTDTGAGKHEVLAAGDLKTASDGGAMAKIERLVGCAEFKALMRQLKSVAPLVRRHETYDLFTYRCYLFSIGAGRGLTTALGLFAELLREEALFRFQAGGAVLEIRLPAPDDFREELAGLVPEFGRGRLVCIDISEWLEHLNEKRFRRFLAVIEDYSADNIVVFRVPFIEDAALEGVRRELCEILTVRTVSFDPFSADELRAVASRALQGYGYEMTEDAWDFFDLLIQREKSDGVFYGINTVHKVVREMIYEKQVFDAADGTDDCLIKREELAGLYAAADYDGRGGEEMLRALCGMDAVRSRVYEIVSQIELARAENLAPPCIHMRFLGNPGTGKTTVARAIGKLLKERGVLRSGGFFEHTGRDLCGRYVGQTAPRTAEICRDAYGSVLFIDEAYSLYKGGENADSFGLEAIDTLISEMENHRGDLVVIMAGYPEEMETLMRANPGLESRMPYVLEFPNFDRAALYAIFMGFCRGRFSYDEAFDEAVRAYFDALPDELLASKEFSNARFVRNLFERTWGKANMRARLHGGDNFALRREDFCLASGEREFSGMLKKKGKSVGFTG